MLFCFHQCLVINLATNNMQCSQSCVWESKFKHTSSPFAWENGKLFLFHSNRKMANGNWKIPQACTSLQGSPISHAKKLHPGETPLLLMDKIVWTSYCPRKYGILQVNSAPSNQKTCPHYRTVACYVGRASLVAISAPGALHCISIHARDFRSHFLASVAA